MCLLFKITFRTLIRKKILLANVIFELATPELETTGFSRNKIRPGSSTLFTLLLVGRSTTLNVKHIASFRTCCYKDCMGTILESTSDKAEGRNYVKVVVFLSECYTRKAYESARTERRIDYATLPVTRQPINSKVTDEL